MSNTITKVELEKAIIIDDSDMDNMLNRMILNTVKYAKKVITYSNAQTALEYLKENTNSEDFPDVIFLDINMPVMNGFEFLEVYDKTFSTECKSKCKIFMLSSSDDLEDIQKASNYKYVKKYLKKPLDKDDLE